MKRYFFGAAVAAAATILLIAAQEPQAPAPAGAGSVMFRTQAADGAQPAQIAAPDPNDPLALMKAGDAAVHARQFAQADSWYAQAVALGDRPEIAPALLYFGIKAYGEKNYLAAEGFLERLLAVSPNSPVAGRALTWMGNIRARDPNTLDEAEGFYKRALAAEDPQSLDTVDTLRSYAVLLKQMGRQDEAAAMEERERTGLGVAREGKAARALPQGVYKAGNGVSAPKLVYKVEPQYTQEARDGKIAGTTVLGVEIGPDGIARNFQVVRSLEPGLDQQAIDAVQQWRFDPGTKDGAPVTVAATIEINFRLK